MRSLLQARTSCPTARPPLLFAPPPLSQSASVGDDTFGISFWNATHGLLGGNDAVIGGDVWRSSNGGVTWASVDWSFFPLTESAVSATPDAGMVCGPFGVQYTVNGGANWTQANGDVADCVSARRAGFANGYGIVGDLGLLTDTVGCAVSTNNGADWTLYDASSVAQYVPLYGSFPTPSTWYLSAGGSDANGNPVGGQILKTASGGANWTVAYTSPATTRTVGIDCADAANCCMAQVDGVGNASISCSHDGGATWQLGFNVSGTPGSTIINDIRATSTSGWWAIGGIYPSVGWVLHSTDGVAWSIDTTLQYYGAAIDVAPDGSLFGIVFETVGDDGFANYVIAGQ